MSTTTNPPDPPTTIRNPLVLYLIFGIVMAVGAMSAYQLAAGSLNIPLTDETLRLLRDEANAESQAKAKIEVYANDRLNCGVLLALLLGAVGAGFGILEGVRMQRLGRAVLGGVVGVMLGGVTGWLAGPLMREVQKYFVGQLYDGVTSTILIHGLTWVMCVVVAAVATAVASMNIVRGGNCFATGLLGAGLGVVLFALLAGTFFPNARTEEFRFYDTNSRVLWACLPSMLLSLAIWRAAPHAKAISSTALPRSAGDS